MNNLKIKNSGQFQKGHEKTGGREKGTLNKVTAEMREKIALLLDGDYDKFQTALDSLKPQEYVRVYTSLLNFVLPKQAPLNPESLIEKERIMLQELVLSLPDEMVERIARRLNELDNENKIE